MPDQAFLHADIPMDRYVRDAFDVPPTLSSSVAHRLITRSPLHAKTCHPRLNDYWQPEDERTFDLGNALHAVLLENKQIQIVPFDDYRTKAAQAARKVILLRGEIPALPRQIETITGMVRAVNAKLVESPDLADVDLAMLDAEHTAVWQEGETWCRCRPDWLTKERDVIFSVKTTGNADPEAFLRGPMMAHGYDVQAACELSAVEALTGKSASYVYVVVETDPPHGVSLIGLSPMFRQFALDKFDGAVRLWANCLATNSWPAYPDRIHYLEPLPWQMARAMERGSIFVHDDGRPLDEQL